jgi:zinc protease
MKSSRCLYRQKFITTSCNELASEKNRQNTSIYGLSGAGRQPGRREPAGIMDINMTSAVLDNGLTVVVSEVHTAPLASVWCWYKVGSKDEITGLTGVSHWVEHMNFKGTTNIPRDQVKGIIEKFGGSWNGYTWIDQTTYMETASTAGLDRMLFIEAERMANCIYDPQDCESERTVIISELEGGENDPDTLLEQEVIAAAYKVHPYRHPTIGWLSDLKTMTRDDLYQYYRRNYIPNNATVVVVGDVETDDVLRRVEKQFGAIPSGPAPRRVSVVEPQQFGERRVEVAREGTTAYLKLAYHAPALADRDFFPMLVLDAILTGAKGINLWSSFRTPPPQRSARLYRALVECRLASSVGAGLLPTEHPFLYLISATAMEGVSLQEVEGAATAALDNLVRGGITERELLKAKNQLRARLVFENDSVTNLGHQLGYFQTVANLDIYRDAPSRIAAVTQDQVNAVAKKYLRTDRRTVGWFSPMDGAEE